MRKIAGVYDPSGVTPSAEGLYPNVLSGTALGTIVRPIPLEFRAVLVTSAGSNIQYGDFRAQVQLVTDTLASQFLALVPDIPFAVARATSGSGAGVKWFNDDSGSSTTLADAFGGGLIHRVGMTDDDIVYSGEVEVEQLGSLALRFPANSTSPTGVKVVWEALYR